MRRHNASAHSCRGRRSMSLCQIGIDIEIVAGVDICLPRESSYFVCDSSLPLQDPDLLPCATSLPQISECGLSQVSGLSPGDFLSCSCAL